MSNFFYNHQVKSNSEILCEWDPVILKSKMVLNYLLYKGKIKCGILI